MRTLSLCVLALALSVSAYAASTNVWTVDLTKGLHDVRINLLDDSRGQPAGGGVDILLPVIPGATMMVGFGGARDDFNKYRKACEVRGLLNRGNVTVIRLNAHVEFDNGDACLVRVSYSNGAHAQVALFKTGT